MPAILVASKMKSGLPKPVHSTAPIQHIPARTIPQPCYLKLRSKLEVSKPTYSSQIPFKSPHGHEEEGAPHRKSTGLENGFDTQGFDSLTNATAVSDSPNLIFWLIYTDWANHYLAKSGHKRLIKDLQQDVTDGVLLAEIIQVVANEKIEDINDCPKSRSQMIENIDACLSFLAAKGVNIQGLSAEGYFGEAGYYRAFIAVKKLPGPSTRMSAAGSETKTRGSVSANNRRSQSFNNCDKSKPAHPPPPASSQEKVFYQAGLPIGLSNPYGKQYHKEPNSANKPWRSKSLSAKHTATSSMLSVKQPSQEAPPKPPVECAKTTPNGQKSMLEKLKLFNTKGGSKTAGATLESSVSRNVGSEKVEVPSNAEEPEDTELSSRGVNGTGAAANSPKIALKGIAQRTFSRALTTKKSSLKSAEKEKQKEKDKAKEISKRVSVTEKPETKEEPKEELAGTAMSEPKKTSKIASFIPKGGKLSSAKKETSAPAHSGIPKPGAKTSATGKSAGAPSSSSSSGKEGERPRSAKFGPGLSLHKGQLDSRHSSSSSSLASSEGKAIGGTPHQANSGAQAGTSCNTQTTGSNTISVQLPQPQQQYNHPNTATVAPFMYRSQTDIEGNMNTDCGSGGGNVDPAAYTKAGQPAVEDLSGEDPEARRLRTVKNIADLRQNLEETMSSLRGTQVTHSRALTTKKSSLKSAEKEKQKEKDKAKEISKRVSVTEKPETKEEPKEELAGTAMSEPKKTSKIASFIPKGGKLSSAKKETSAPAHSGIPKPGAKTSATGKSAGAPSSSSSSGKEGERPRSAKLGPGLSLHKGQLDSRHSSSSSSLASSEGKAIGGTPHQANSGAQAGTSCNTQTTGSNTISVQLPQPQQQYNHPNTATVAPFMYRSQTDIEGNMNTDCGSGGGNVDPAAYTKAGQPAVEDLSGEDPEARRLRTVKNIADLRQNLEETMSSLRGTQVTHSTLETTFDSNVTTEISGRSILSLTARSTPLSWRLGQSSPRLQAGDAPSLGNGFPPRGNASRFINSESGRYMYSAPLRRQLAARGSNVCSADLADKDDLDLEGIHMEATGYMSDGDVLGKKLQTDDVSSGYLTDGGLGLYTRRLNRLPDGMAAVRETVQRNTSMGVGDADSWDDSSSESSGISDTIDNLSTDDINTSSSISSYANTPAAPRKSIDSQPQTDTEKHCAVERNSMRSGDEMKKSDGGSDSGVKMESGSKWRRNPSDVSDESDKSNSGRKTTVISQTGSWRRGMTAQVGITTPRTKNATLKTHGTGKTDDAKASEKGRLSPKSANVQHSPSDAGRSSGDETKKPPSSASRTPTNTFGFKKQPGGMTIITASGATITSGSATLGKIPKSSGLIGRSGSRMASVDGSHQDDAYLPISARTNLQYRSLPRPSKSGSGGRNGNRSSTSSIDSNLSSKSAGLPVPKIREPSKVGMGSSPLPGGANQTDREKGVSSDTESVASCNSIKASPTSHSGASQSGRQQGSKYADVSSPTLRRLFGGKPGKQAPVTTAENMKNSTVITNPHATMTPQTNLDSPSGSGMLSSGGSSPLYNKTTDLAQSSMASSPGSAHSAPSNSLTWGTNLSSSSTVSKDGLGYQSVSSLHTSCESIDISLSSGGISRHNSTSGLVPFSKEESLSAMARNNSVKTALSERYPPSSQLRSQEDAKEWLRSHSAGGLQESASNSPFSPGSSITSPSGTRFNFAQLASPTTAAQINLANSSVLWNQEGPLDPYSDPRFRNSSMSLDEKIRSMSRSGSFRDGFEEVHGSSLSLVSSTSSIYSTPEEKSQSEIRKLRRELDASQEKVSALTTQLSANAHLVAAFEQSLGNMTIRLQSLTMTAEQKDSELNELKKTIEYLKKQNAAAQAAINGVINTPELACKATGNGTPQSADLRIRRQHSSDSVSSINSATSHSSVGSNVEVDSKKKKKKNWLRSSFKQAFGKKKSPKSASSHSDIEEMTDSSLPSSPKLPRNGSTASTPLRRTSHSNSFISECTEGEAETVMQLRSELRDKEMKLTDIRLEALSSAHQLDQLREAMNRMQGEIEKLKIENDRLKSENQGVGSRAPSQLSISSSPRQSVGLSQHSLSLTESTSLDMLLDDNADGGTTHKEGRHVKIVVSLRNEMKRKEECRPRRFLVGCIGVSGKTKWDVLDGVVRRLFKEYIIHVDPMSQLGLNSDSVLGYSIGDIHRTAGAQTPELLPCGYLVGDNNTISVTLKGVSEHSQDCLVFETLIPKPMLQRYVSLLSEHRRIILSGPSGTGKTYLANRLAEYLVLKEGRELTDGVITTFNELRQYLSSLADQCNSESSAVDVPLVIILDNLHHVSCLGEIFNGLLNCKYHRCPYIIGTMNQATSSAPNLQLHHNFRWVLCANHTEPVKGFLGRFLRRKLIETEISSRMRNTELVKIIDWIPKVWQHLNEFLEAHSSSDVTIGPRLFLSCPIDVAGSRVWFTDLWNYSIIPYMLEAVREGLQLYGRRAPWEDPAKWVMDTYPWSASPQQHEWPPLLQLRPEDVGFDGCTVVREGCSSKQVPQSDEAGDPLMNMLMRLQEAANYSSPQSYDSDSNSNSHHDDILDSSLESTL
ncbi:Neuron navigator 2 [Acipenser ruthenus]|uniref:Neuron navigator 2 n=1 Tax=Acipenser ruthenus TaxID=7906 RepID=A0A444U997_ACIRT|nr:Neuron navigator 2 [Acipenser ruthenus]